MRQIFTPVILLAVAGLTACGQPFWLPPAHKIEVQQGNLISESQKESIVVGSTREQVLNALGQPMSQNLFHENRWDYLYTRAPAGTTVVARRLTIFFENDTVVNITDNHEAESGEGPGS